MMQRRADARCALYSFRIFMRCLQIHLRFKQALLEPCEGELGCVLWDDAVRRAARSSFTSLLIRCFRCCCFCPGWSQILPPLFPHQLLLSQLRCASVKVTRRRCAAIIISLVNHFYRFSVAQAQEQSAADCCTRRRSGAFSWCNI
jgi:hypothetical protein